MWLPNRVALTIGGVPVYWYGVIIASAVFLALLLGSAREKRLGFEKDTTITLALWVVPFALVGARLYYVLFTWDQYANNLLSILDVRSGGMAIYGGLIGGVLAGFVYTRVKHLSFLRLCDLIAPSLALGQAIGRWGNFFNQEAYGYQVLNPNFQFFPLSVFIEASGTWHLATFFYESLWCFLIVAVLLIATKKGALKRPGDCFLWYVLLYAFERMIVEGLRTDSLMLGPVRISQCLSALAVLACLGIWLHRRRKK
ncbi:MAG: prolipoprotein diacylglyceryl transferase [Clostridia bacterium]